MNRTMRFWVTCVMPVAAVVLAQAVHAVSITENFTGSSPGDWAVAGNWSAPSRVPGSDAATYDYAVIDNKIVTLNTSVAANARLNTIFVKGGGAFNIQNGGNIATSDGENWDQGWIYVGHAGTAGTLTVDAGASGGLSVKEFEAGTNGPATFTLTSGVVRVRGRQTGIGGGGYTTTVNLNGGTFYNPSPYGIQGATATNSHVTVTQAGATVTTLNNGIFTVFAGGANSSMTWNLQSGAVNFGPTTLGANATGVGSIIQTGGTMLIGAGAGGAGNQFVNFNVGGTGTGFYSISGGTIDTVGQISTPDGNMTLGYGWGSGMLVGNSTGQGTLKIIGSNSTVKFASYWAGGTETFFMLGANGTLIYEINSPTITPIQIEGRGGAAGQNKQASLAGIIDLDLNSYTPGFLSTYDLLTARTILNNGVALTTTDVGFWLAPADVGVWALSVVGTAGSGQTLRATFLPEPTSLALLALGGLALLRRRR